MKIFKRISKGLKKASKSKFGKLIMAGAAMYVGGAIMGKMFGAGGTAAAGTTTAGGTAATGMAGVAEGAAGAGAGEAVTGKAAATLAPAAEAAKTATTATKAAKSGGLISNAIKGIGGFVEKNPMASSMMFNAAASALSPDETELLEEQDKIRRRRYMDMEVPDSIGLSPGTGIINRGIRQ